MSKKEDKMMFQAIDINKTYESTHALNNVSIDIPRGKVVGLVGENGAGKSTLMKIILGLEQPDSGDMYRNGEEYAPTSPLAANRQGVGMVFQEQSLITNLTVAQNLFLGWEEKFKKGPFVDWTKMNAEAQLLLDSFDLGDISAKKKVSELGFSRRQMVEIAKVLNIASINAGEGGALILLDEPTSVLNDEEIRMLFANVRKITQAGNSAIFVSHRLDEVMSLCDVIYVMKDGKNVCTISQAEATEEKLYQAMVGKSTSSEYYKVNRQTQPQDEVLLEAKNLALFGYFKNVSFTLHKGEILGIMGSVGSGKEALVDVITGIEKETSGELYVKGNRMSFSSPAKALEAGIMHVPENRREEGQFDGLSIQKNIGISSLDHMKRRGLIDNRQEEETAEKWIKDINIKCASRLQPIGALSGGNAQKVIFARAFSSKSAIVVLNHPTRGVDVGAKAEIYDIIRSATDTGIGIILLADTFDECIGLSSKVFTMKDGLVTKCFDAAPGNKPEQADIIQYMV